MYTFIRYYFKEFFRYFMIFLLLITAISIVAEFFDKAPEFYREKPPISLIIKYLLLQAPRVILFALPFASLFSVLITLGIASKWKELVIIKASGNSIKKVFSSFLILGVLISILAFTLGETIVPAATRMAVYVRKAEILKQPRRIMYREEALWLKGTNGSLIRIDNFLGNQNRIYGTSIFSFDSSFHLVKRIEAEAAEWVNGAWDLKDTVIFDFKKSIREGKTSIRTNAIEEPRVFKEEMKKPREMSFSELYTYYSRLEKAGFMNLQYQVRLYEKLAYPSINFVMILFGLSLALSSSWGGGIRSTGLGVIISVAYWMFYSVCISLGNTGMVLPWVAPWISPVVFSVLGAVFYSRIRE